MLRIEEIVGAMDDEFRYALDALAETELLYLRDSRAALRRLRPVGVSHAEAVAMIDAIILRRAAQAQMLAEKQRRRRYVSTRVRKTSMPPPAFPVIQPQKTAEQPKRVPPCLPAPVTVALLAAPVSRVRAIPLPSPGGIPSGPVIILPAPSPTVTGGDSRLRGLLSALSTRIGWRG